MTIEINQITDLEGCQVCHTLANQIWGGNAACSVAQMSVHAKYGGVLLVARSMQIPVGFLFSFPVRYKGEWVLWSHETGVLSDYQGQGIGSQLKRKQRMIAKHTGYTAIAWTFDPLVARNAHFNLNKLGARLAEYQSNVYGIMESDFINQDLPTDRWIALWSVENEQNVSLAENVTNEKETLLDVNRSFQPIQSIQIETLPPHVALAVRIPIQIEEILRYDPPLALRWRLIVREIVTNLWRSGYRVQSFQTYAQYGEYVWRKMEVLG